MTSPISAVRFAAIALVGIACWALPPVKTLGAGADGVVVDREIAGPPSSEAGTWRTKTQSIFDPGERALLRRMYTVWDAAPSRNLDFVWIADSLRDDQEGRVTGKGRLIWRFKGKPAYDLASV